MRMHGGLVDERVKLRRTVTIRPLVMQSGPLMRPSDSAVWVMHARPNENMHALYFPFKYLRPWQCEGSACRAWQYRRDA